MATSALDRSPRPPELRCPRRGARLHRILIAPGPRRPPRSRQTRRLFARGHRGWASAAAKFVLSRWLAPCHSPQQLGLRGVGVRGTQSAEGIPPPPPPLPPTFRGGRTRAGAAARPALSAPQFSHLRRSTQGLGDPRAPEVCSCSSRALRLFSRLARPAGPVGVGSWAGGWGLGRRRCTHGKVRLEAQQQGLGTRMRPLCSGPPPSSLGFAETPTPYLPAQEVVSKLGVCPKVCSRGHCGLARQGAGCRLLQDGGGAQGALGSSRTTHYPSPPTARVLALQAADFPGSTKPASGAVSRRAQAQPRRAALASPRPGVRPAPPRGPSTLALPGKEALTIKNVTMYAFNPQRSLPLKEAAAADPGVRGRFAEAPGWGSREAAAGCPRGFSSSGLGWAPCQRVPQTPSTPTSTTRVFGPGPGSPGREDGGGEDRPGRAPTFQTPRPRPKPGVRNLSLRLGEFSAATSGRSLLVASGGNLAQVWRPIYVPFI